MPMMFVYTKAQMDDRYSGKMFSKGCSGIVDKDALKEKVLKTGIRFKLKDDDGETHFEGRYLDLDDPRNINFEPLDQQQENTGATSMLYYQDGKWQEL